jgi:DNA repair exonuclease SbcCD ATPase subunit
MPETESFLHRISRIFRRPEHTGGNGFDESPAQSPPITVETNPITLRPWRKNTAAIAQLQEGFHSLTDLMNEIRQNMVAQGRRQDELIGYLSTLPKLIESIPESGRLQSETLKAIQSQLERQIDQQQTLGEILEKMSESGGDQKDLLEGLRERVETLNQQDKAMADSLGSVSAALVQASRHSAAGTQVLESLRENFKSRDAELEGIIRRQNVRFTILLVSAICISVAALATVLGLGYMALHVGIK